MLKTTNSFDELSSFESGAKGEIPLTHLAGELIEQLGYNNLSELEDALHRTFAACCQMHISIQMNFVKVYSYDGESLREDWLLSDLGYYLLMINGNPSNPNIAKAQVYFIARSLSKRQ